MYLCTPASDLGMRDSFLLIVLYFEFDNKVKLTHFTSQGAFLFLWNDVSGRIRRQVVTQGYAESNLKMVDIALYTSSLKLSWIRLFQSSAKWQSPFNHMLKKHPFLWDMATLYYKHILQDSHIIRSLFKESSYYE